LSATRKIEAEAARAVTGDVEELGLRPVGWGRGGFVKKLGGLDGAELFGKTEREHGIRLKAEKSGVGMVVDGATSPFGKVGGIPDVVPVAVGEKEGVGFHFLLFQKIEKTFGCIDGKEMAVEIEEICVRGSKAACVGQKFVHLVLRCEG
jgi:hypothetical protein